MRWEDCRATACCGRVLPGPLTRLHCWALQGDLPTPLSQAGELGGEEDIPSEEEDGAAAAAAAAGGAARSRRAASRRQPGGPPGSSNFLVACVEQPAGTGAAAHAVEVGLVAVEPSTGAVLYAQFRCGCGAGLGGGVEGVGRRPVK